MKQIILLVFLAAVNATVAFAGTEESVEFGGFGKLTLYYNSPHPSHVVLFVSGVGGWNLGVVDMARELANLDSLVVGIDITHYIKELGKKITRHTIYNGKKWTGILPG